MENKLYNLIISDDPVNQQLACQILEQFDEKEVHECLVSIVEFTRKNGCREWGSNKLTEIINNKFFCTTWRYKKRTILYFNFTLVATFETKTMELIDLDGTMFQSKLQNIFDKIKRSFGC